MWCNISHVWYYNDSHPFKNLVYTFVSVTIMFQMAEMKAYSCAAYFRAHKMRL